MSKSFIFAPFFAEMPGKRSNAVCVDTKAVSLACLSLVGIVGNIARILIPIENVSGPNDNEVLVELKGLYRVIVRIADLLQFSIFDAFLVKMSKNEEKYPPSECTSEVKTIADHTGLSKEKITSSEQLYARNRGSSNDFGLKGEMKNIARRVELFGSERGWSEKYTRHSVALAMASEVGELCDLFAWVEMDKDTPIGIEKFALVQEEVVDVFVYMMHLLRVSGYKPSELE